MKVSRSGLHQVTRPMMGTFVTMTVEHEAEAVAREAIDAAFEAMEDWCGIASEWLPDSAISTFANAPAHREVELPPPLFDLLRLAKRVWAASGGAFDPTWLALKPLWVWQDGSSPPDAAALKKALKRVGFEAVELSDTGTSARITRGGVRLGLGGIAKGAAVDVACRVLGEAGLHAFLVNAGGDLAGRSDAGWQVGLHCSVTNASTLRLLECGAVATSGTSEQGFVQAGRRYHHLLDPRTGWPAPWLGSVTVSAPDCALADALATACFVLGPDDGAAFIRTFDGCGARWVTLDADGKPRTLDLLPEPVRFPPAAPLC